MGKGRFLVLDGPDGAGKSTQAAKLVERLKAGHFKAEHLRDPGSTDFGEKLRQLLLDPLSEISLRSETLLFLACRAQLVEEKIRPALEAGKIVVCERFHASTIAYQGSAAGVDPGLIEKLCHFSSGGLTPDMMILLDLDPEESMRRVGEKRDRLEMRSRDYHERVRLGFMQYALSHPGAVSVIEALGTEEEVHDAIWTSVAGIL